jgi:hypothetical protein
MDLHYVYKIFLECTARDNGIAPGMETLDVGWFSRDHLPELSTPRNTAEQMQRMFDFRENLIPWPLVD